MRACLILLFTSALLGCSDEQACEPLPDDGKLHPEPNGEHIAEADACTLLKAAYDDRGMALACVLTSGTCPSFVVTKHGAGKEYDKGSVDGCAAFFTASKDCQELKEAPDGCLAVTYPEPEDPCAAE